MFLSLTTALTVAQIIGLKKWNSYLESNVNLECYLYKYRYRAMFKYRYICIYKSRCIYIYFINLAVSVYINLDV